MRAAVFLTFWSGTLLRWKSATAAALMTMPAEVQVLHHLRRAFRRAVRTWMTSTPRGGGRWTGPETRIDAGAAGGGGFGQRVAHLAAGAIGDVADRVERFLGGAGGDQHGLAFEIAALVGGAFDGGGDGFGIGQASGAGHAAGQIAAVGFDDDVAALDEGFQVGLGGGVLPHVDVHGGGEHDGAGEGEIEGGEKIVGQAVGEFRHQVRGGGRDDEDFVFLRRRRCARWRFRWRRGR